MSGDKKPLYDLPYALRQAMEQIADQFPTDEGYHLVKKLKESFKNMGIAEGRGGYVDYFTEGGTEYTLRYIREANEAATAIVEAYAVAHLRERFIERHGSAQGGPKIVAKRDPEEER